MKNHAISTVVLLFIFGCTIPTFAQSEVNINRLISGRETKTVSQARSIALTNTVLSIGAGVGAVAFFDNKTIKKTGAYLAVYGIVAGASTGNFYAEDYPRGVIGMGARTIGAILMVDATREIFGHKFANTLSVDDQQVSLTDTKMLIGEAFLLAGLVYNLVSVNQSVEEYNVGKRSFSVNVTPEVINDDIAPVLTASFRF
jgi:hypothetical protein